MCPADPAPSAESGSPTGQESHTPAPEASLTHLIAALADQTAAINRLASSNEAMTQAIASLIEDMANAEDAEEEPAPGGYLNSRTS